MYFVTDAETTGFHAYEGDEIISFAFILLDADLREVVRKQYFVWPSADCVVQPDAALVNGYTPALWAERGAVSQDAFFKQLREDWRTYRVSRAWPTGHNVSFDVNFLEARGRIDPTFREDMKNALSYHMIDTISLAVPLDTAHKVRDARYKLTNVCERWGIPLTNAHDAMADTEATAELLRRLIGALRGATPPPPVPPDTSVVSATTFKTVVKARAAMIREQLAARRADKT